MANRVFIATNKVIFQSHAAESQSVRKKDMEL